LAWLAFAFALGACAAEPATHGTAATQARADCVAPGAWYVLEASGPRATPAPEIMRAAAASEVVLLGERHDAEDHHRWQLHTLAALHAQRPDMAIGFESFPRRVQPVLDRWVAGELDADAFLAQAEWQKVWNLPARLYLPLFEFARIHRIPMFAMNVERELTRTIATEGWDAVPEARREGVGRPAAPSPEYVDALFEVYRHHPLAGGDAAKTPARDDPAFRRFVESQTTWDRAMAEAVASQLRKAPAGELSLVVGIAGSGHLRNGFGVPRQLRDLGVARVTTLLPVDVPQDCKALVPALADAVFALPPGRAAPPPKPRLGVQLTQKDGTVVIVAVMEDSLAASMDLRAGDAIVSLAGTPVSRLDSVIAAVRAQPPGTWLPIELRRDGETLERVIKFPPAKPG
ncbi:MAG: ChaN family lipoprotein, partial [Burkholderiales bacterium]|nr:ChaN family lipoprotein [Burkholderiales bacterium]